MAEVISIENKEEEALSSKFKSVCVFCGSSLGNKESYKAAAIELGQELFCCHSNAQGINQIRWAVTLVYGGGGIGLMGCVAQAVEDGGGQVLGIIPRGLLGVEVTGDTVGQELLVTDMHQRKAEMARHSDCVVALPGGFGTFDELLEVISWAQLGIHDKPVGVLNVDGFYDPFLAHIDKSVAEGFIEPSHRHIIVLATNAKELLQKLEDYVPLHERSFTKESWEVEEEVEEEQQKMPVVGINVAASSLQNDIALKKRRIL